MSLSATADTTYRLATRISYVAPEGATDSGIKLKLTGTATVSAIEGLYHEAHGTSLGVTRRILSAASAAALPVEIDLGDAPSYGFVHVEITLRCSGTGTLKWQVAQSTADGGTTSVLVNSTMALDSY